MAALEKLAEAMVAEIPVTKLGMILKEKQPVNPDDGVICGNGCGDGNGYVCGLRCNPTLPDEKKGRPPYVIDPKGRLGLTDKDITDIRNNLPKLRDALAHEIEASLRQL